MKMIRRLILIFCLLFVSVILAQDNTEDTSMTISALLEKADNLFKARQYDESRDIYIQVMDKAKAEGKNEALTEAYAMIARCYLITDRREEGLTYINLAKEAAAPNEPLGWSRYLGVRGRFEWQDKELVKATATFKMMYKFCSEKKLYERAIDAAHMVAITGTPEMQIEWGKKGIAEAEAGHVTDWLGPLWNNLGASYEDQKKYPEALNAYQKAREYHYKYGDALNKLIADWAVGHSYRLNKDYKNARDWLNPLVKKFEEVKSAEFVGWTNKELAEIAIAKEDYRTALKHMKIAEEKLKTEKMPEWDPEGYQEIVDQIAQLEQKINK
ncbi:MAG: tetratricopeptide repeat protein [Candidatus Zixiibacteriota bacterium]